MLVIVVLVFVFCWGPLLCYNMAVATELIKPYLPTIYPYAKTLNTVFSLLSYCNSCLNPIVYGFMSRYFRKSFKQVCTSKIILIYTCHTIQVDKLPVMIPHLEVGVVLS